MLDIPVVALSLWTVYVLINYLEEPRPKWLYLTIILFVSSLYTKQTIAFLAPVMLWSLLRAHGVQLLRERSFWIALMLLVLLLVPLLWITLKFGQFNAVSVTQEDSSDVKGLNFLYYITILPKQIGWITTLLAAVGIVLLLLRQGDFSHPVRELWVVWIVVGYLFFSLIGLKSARFTLPVIYPLAFLAIWSLYQVLYRHMGLLFSLLLATGVFTNTLTRYEVPCVSGYKKAAELAAKIAPENGVVLFSGYRDGTFIFNMRTVPNRGDLTIIRADKIFFKVASDRSYGIEQTKTWTEKEIKDTINNLGISVIVVQPDFWLDQPVMQQFSSVLQSGSFEQVSRIPVTLSYFSSMAEKELIIYRNLTSVNQKVENNFKIYLPIINDVITK